MTFKPAPAIIMLLLLLTSANAYVTAIHVPAVIENRNIGNLTVMQLNVTPGTGSVQISGPSSVDASTLASAQTAATYAASYLGLKETSYNFNYTISDKNQSVSGPSGGLALALLAVAGLQHRQLAQNFTATGTVSGDGNVGLIGGIYDKLGAAKAGNMKYALVPFAPNSSFEYLLYYISQQQRSIPVVLVANVSQALKYAFGSQKPAPLAINLTKGGNFGAAGISNITCGSCNASAFSQIVNFTFNFTGGAITALGNNFSAARQQLMGNINAYKRLAANGYLYTAANLAFLDFVPAFALSNYRNFTASSASSMLGSVSSYCSSLVPPPLTTANYEYVIGGELRQYWANITLASAQQQLNSEQTTDDIIQSIYTSATALGWCKASNQLFAVAPYLGGSYVQVSPSLRTNAAAAINSARSYGNNIYLQSATQAYSAGDYATALYSATYANVFSPQVPNMSTAQLYSKVLKNIANVTSGTWPSQFASQAEFYFRESVASQGASSNRYAAQAYTTSLLALSLAQVNGAISRSFLASNATVAGLPQQINGIQQSIQQIYAILLVNAVLLFVVLVVLLVHLLPKNRPGVFGVGAGSLAHRSARSVSGKAQKARTLQEQSP